MEEVALRLAMPSFLIALVLTSLFFTIGIACAAGEDVSVYRYRNLQGFEMTPQVHPPGNVSVYRYRNLQGFEMTPQVHPPGNVSVYRYRNLQGFEMTPQVHPPGNVSVYRYRNLQGFEMTPQVHPPGDAQITRFRNLQCFEMTTTGPLSVSINFFATTDQNGDPKDTFAPGSLVLFKIGVYANGSQNIPNALVSVMVQNPAREVVFLSYTFEDIQVGQQTTVYLGTQIPYECMPGEYTAKVNIFTLLPSEGGEPIIGGHEEVTFTVS